MRDFLDAILEFIGSTSLTDDEFNALPGGLTESYSQASYDAVVSVLEAREAVSNERERLEHYFRARGVAVTVSSDGKSNIFVGAELCK